MLLVIVTEWIDISTEEKLVCSALEIEENTELKAPNDDFWPLVMIKYS